MLYDLASSPPEPGSLQESLFMVLSRRRQEQELLRTRLLVEASLAPHLKESKLSEAFDNYFKSMFPYAEEEKREKVEVKHALDHWVGKGGFKVRPIWDSSQKPGMLRSVLERGKKRAAAREQSRQNMRTKRYQ